ncbi:MAG: hypothetical protein GXY15_14355 [Candidatus Hydrogenedentes bacterium]|nr:hypothetical protein [Candidatus Hydrogenedentota bacterium]
MRLPEEMNAWLWYLGGNVVLERLFWASLEMAVLALAVGMVIALARPASPRVRALLWLLVLAKPLAALALGPLYPVLIVEEPQVAYLAVDPAPWDDELLTAPAAPPRPAPAAVPADTAARPWWEAWADVARRADPRRAGAALWGLLAGLMALHRALDAVRLRRLVRRGAAPSAACAALYAEAARGLEVRRPPRLVVTDEVESPALAGTLRPVVLLPAWLHTAGEPGVVSWALRHELMHWKLGDTLSNLVRQAARALFFFHPATWWAAARWEEEAELACDRALINTPGEADAYAGTLYEVLAQMRGRRDRAFAGTLGATRTQIGKRIAALLANPLRCPARPGMWAVAGLLLLAAAALGTGGTFGGQVSADTPPDTIQAELEKALERPASLVFNKVHLWDVLSFAADAYDVDFALDWRVIAPPPRRDGHTVKGGTAAYATDGMVAAVDCRDVALREALTKMLEPLGLAYESAEGVVWVSTPEQLRRDAADGSARAVVPAPGAFPEWDKVLNAPTTVEFEDIHVQQVVEFLADSYDLPLVLDTQAIPPPSEDQSTWLYGPVGPDGIRGGAPPFEGEAPPAGTWLPRVFLGNVAARTALSCMLRPLNLVCVPKNGKLLVTARGAQAPAGTGTVPALVRVRTLDSGVKRALIRDTDGGLHWYNEGARVGDFTVTEINAVKKTARLVADDGQGIHMVAETRDGAPEPAWTGPYVAFRWEARDGGGEEVPWAKGHGEGRLRLEPEALLTEYGVLRAAIRPSEDGRTRDVLLTLRPEAAAAFGAATEAGVGRKLAIVFDGEVVSAPEVRSRITEGVMIPGLSWSEAQGVVESVEMAPKPGEEAAAAAQAGEEKGPQYAVEARFFHVPRMGLAETVMSSPQWVNQMFVETRSPEDVRVFRFPDAEQVLNGLEKVEGTMLVSAPRCTFIPGKTPPKVLWRRDENRNPGPGDAPLRTLDALSPSFSRFRAQTPPCVVMADLTTQPVSGEGNQAPLHEGVVFALAAGAAGPPAPLDVTVYLNELRRGTAPKVRDHPVTLRMPLAPGETVAVVCDTEAPETVQFVLLTLSAVDPAKRGRFFEEPAS